MVSHFAPFYPGKFNNKFNAFTLMTQETVTTPPKHAHIDIETFTIRLHVWNELLIISNELKRPGNENSSAFHIFQTMQNA